MKYDRFESLPVWKDALHLANRIYDLVDDRACRGQGDLRNQLQRAALSVSNNIAEGFERGTTQELLTFLYIARGSAGEVRSMLIFMASRPAFSHIKPEISNLNSLAESISRQLRAWADSLQNSPITGQRYLNETVREEAQRKTRQQAFLEKLDQIKNQGVRKSEIEFGDEAP